MSCEPAHLQMNGRAQWPIFLGLQVVRRRQLDTAQPTNTRTQHANAERRPESNGKIWTQTFFVIIQKLFTYLSCNPYSPSFLYKLQNLTLARQQEAPIR